MCYLCLGNLVSEHLAVLIKKDSSHLPGKRTADGHPSRAA